MLLRKVAIVMPSKVEVLVSFLANATKVVDSGASQSLVDCVVWLFGCCRKFKTGGSAFCRANLGDHDMQPKAKAQMG